ncbi:MAG: SDR family NAD(P)-dependent oxidoreductase, partial [Rhodospirillaceae bacterium]|nr:SDR family NAD(P)-dependent oxidoreductase [Rhodospirillaceae bacterium]
MPNSRFDLSSRTALVTGASRGIGQALAVGLAEAGADVIVSARSTADLEETAEAIRSLGRRAWVEPCDVSATAEIDALFGRIAAAGLGPDILVNNA